MKNKTVRFWNTFGATALMIAGLAAAVALFFVTVPQQFAPEGYLLCIVILVAGYFVNRLVHALLHETGHLLFGAANGFRLYEFAVGPFRLIRRGKGLRFRFGRSRYGGMVLMANTRPDALEKRYFRLTLGGVLFSCLAAAGAAVLVWFTRGINFYGWCVLLPGIPVSWRLVALNAFAFEEDGVCSDGAVLAGIRRNDPSVRLNVRLMAIQSMLCAGKAPSEIERNYFYDGTEAEGINRIQLLNYRYIYELDSGNWPAAEAISDEIAQHLDEIPDVYRPGILTDYFYTELHKGNLDRAKLIWVEIEPYVKRDPNICNLRIRMAYELECKDNPRLAIATGKTALQAKDEYPIPGVAKMEERLIGELTAEAARRAEAQKKPLSDDLPEYKG